MADLGIADYTIREYPPEQQDSVKEILVKELLRIHQLDRKELDTNLYLYQMDSRAYQDVLELMIPRIVQLKNQVDLPGNTE